MSDNFQEAIKQDAFSTSTYILQAAMSTFITGLPYVKSHTGYKEHISV
jgi:hypothetical protein